ncbi:MAG: VWA domain-containing protein [Planctomycetes bacterium]|nr:VWA domain-containing protein [Planctomycetota bacterium]
MQLSCVHCGKQFSISVDQLGGAGRCPHCRGEIRLPKAEDPNEQPEDLPAEHSPWWENSVSGLTSLVFHLILILIFALIKFGGQSGEGLAEDVLIGELPSVQLGDAQDEELSQEEQPTSEESAEELDEMLEVEPPIEPTTDDFSDEQLAVVSPSTSGSDSGSFDLGTVTVGGGSMAGGGWDGFLQNLRRNGLDIVITFDSTGSMGGEIREVKEQVKRIGGTLLKMVPKARISICTYRDNGDAFVVRGLPLTSDITEIDEFLAGIDADGGGDEPEAVQEGLRWAVDNNQFRTNARKMLLLFGDAPPHRQDHGTCLSIASDFQREHSGIVSTVTCRRGTRLDEFIEIAEMGGGEAFLTSDERQIMEQLIVLVFGSRFRSKVLEAFEIMGR